MIRLMTALLILDAIVATGTTAIAGCNTHLILTRQGAGKFPPRHPRHTRSTHRHSSQLRQGKLAQQLRQLGDVHGNPPRHSEKLVGRHCQWIVGSCF